MTSIKEVTTTVNTELYVCDTCHTEYQLRSDAAHCERVHRQKTCKHANLHFSYIEGCWSEEYSKKTKLSNSVVEVTCKDCKAFFGRKTLLNKQTKEIEEFFKKMYLDSTEKIDTPSCWKHIKKPDILLKKK